MRISEQVCCEVAKMVCVCVGSHVQDNDLMEVLLHQIELISATKANILKNDDKIHKMLNSIAFLST